MKMLLAHIFSKASDFFHLTPPGFASSHNRSFSNEFNNDEIVFSKNGVCVHPSAQFNRSFDHVPGYLVIKSKTDKILGSTLILSWIPNTTVESDPSSVKNSPAVVRSPRKDSKTSRREELTASSPSSAKSQEDKETAQEIQEKNRAGKKLSGPMTSIEMDGDSLMVVTEEYGIASGDDDDEYGAVPYVDPRSDDGTFENPQFSEDDSSQVTQFDIPSVHSFEKSDKSGASPYLLKEEDVDGGFVNVVINPEHPSGDISSLSSSSSSSSRGEVLSLLSDLSIVCDLSDQHASGPSQSSNCDLPNMKMKNTHFSTHRPECGKFVTDLSQMRSIRIFFSDPECTRGQLVIASRECQHKVFHFHNGGLDKLSQICGRLSFLDFTDKQKESELSEPVYQHFSVIHPLLPKADCHSEEDTMEPLSLRNWTRLVNGRGCVTDEQLFKKTVFFAGVEPSMRAQVWPFLLGFYPYSSSYRDRLLIRATHSLTYQGYKDLRKKMTTEEREHFYRRFGYTIEKDVVRTDKSHPYYKGEDNRNLHTLQEILTVYALVHPENGYTQGMSDLLAPILAEMRVEEDAYWCFEGLMRRTIFFTSPKDIDMDNQLNLLRELIFYFLFDFYKYASCIDGGLELLFSHRWLLLCFKREFHAKEALKIWESCWSCPETDHFHLFVCLAVIGVYGADDVVKQRLTADEMMLHFNSLSMHMNADVVLKKARSILYQFTKMDQMPCTLLELCSSSRQRDSWEKNCPLVECVCHDGGEACPANRKKEA